MHVQGHSACIMSYKAQFPSHGGRGVRGAKPPGKHGGFGEAAGPPNGRVDLGSIRDRFGGDPGSIRDRSGVDPLPGSRSVTDL